MKKQIFLVGCILTLFVLASVCPSWAQSTVKVGVMYSITGAGSAVGKIQIDGVKLAAKQVNEKGGLKMGGKKAKVELVIRDDETKPDVGVRRLREFFNDNIKLMDYLRELDVPVPQGFLVAAEYVLTFAHVSTAINEQIKGGQGYFMATNGIQEKVFRKENKAPYYISTLGAVDGIGRMCADYVAKTYKPKGFPL